MRSTAGLWVIIYAAICNGFCLAWLPSNGGRSIRRGALGTLRCCLVDTMQGGGFYGRNGGELHQDWRHARAREIAGTEQSWRKQLSRNQNPELSDCEAWAHMLSHPEKGCVLLAQPGLFVDSQPYFYQAVVFIVEHGDKGSAGLILNRPTDLSMGKIADVPIEFTENEVYLGGDVGGGMLHMIHPCMALNGSREIIPGVFSGGDVHSAWKHIRYGQYRPKDFKFFVQACGWGPGQLEREIAEGVWLNVATSPNIVLKSCWRLAKPLWTEVMELLGEEYSKMAHTDNSASAVRPV